MTEQPEQPTLHMFREECDVVIAATAEDAVLVWQENTGEPYYHEYRSPETDEWERVPDDEQVKLCFPDEPGNKTETRTAAEWVELEGRCFFSSTEC